MTEKFTAYPGSRPASNVHIDYQVAAAASEIMEEVYRRARVPLADRVDTRRAYSNLVNPYTRRNASKVQIRALFDTVDALVEGT